MQSDLKVQTEATVCASQEQALTTNYTKNKIDRTSEYALCAMLGERGETVQYIIIECKKLVQGEYKRRHDTVVKSVHWKCTISITLKEKRSGTSIALKELWKMMMLN